MLLGLLFGKNGLAWPKGPERTEAERLLKMAKELRELAARGMKTKAYTKKADALERQAAALAPDEDED